MNEFPVVDPPQATHFFIKKEFLPARLAKEITDSLTLYALVTPMTLGGREIMWRYDDDSGIFRPDGESHVRQWTKYILGEKSTPHRVNQVVELIKIDTYIDPHVFNSENPNKIVCLNGVINLETMELEGFDPELFAKCRIPVRYDPEATCPNIEKFLDEVAGPYMITIIEWGGYCLLKAIPIHRFVVFLGGGMNGKGTCISLIDAFLGCENVAGVPLQALDGNIFMSSRLYGKLANFYTDLSKQALKNTGTLKALTSGDKINAQYKFKDSFEFRSYAKLLFSCNELPATLDQTTAFFRRYIGVPFDNIFEDGVNADPHILEKLTTPEELSGFLNLALKGLTRVLEKGVFTLEKPLEDKKIDYISRSNLIQYFALTQVVKDSDIDSYMTNTDLYSVYASFCRKRGETPKANNVFSREIRRFLPYADQGTTTIGNRRGVKIWRGIGIRYMDLPKSLPVNKEQQRID